MQAHRSSRSSRSRQTDPIANPQTGSSSSMDYAQQLHTAILNTRESIIVADAKADSQSHTALGALDISRSTFADARIGLKNANASLAISAFLDQKWGDADHTAQNLVALAENSNEVATATASAMNDAALSIKAAVKAVETIILDVNGVAGVTKNNDSQEPINVAAQEAVNSINAVGSAIEELKCLALAASIQAASPRTAAPLQVAQANQANISNILATMDAALKTTVEAVIAAQTVRTNDLTNLYSQSTSYTIASSDDSALSKAIDAVDSVSNDSLSVVIHNSSSSASSEDGLEGKVTKGDKNAKSSKGDKAKSGEKTPSADGQSKPGFLAQWKFTPDVAEETAQITCFAVPLNNVASFDFDAAVAAQRAKNGASFPSNPENDVAVDKLQTGSVELYLDSDGNAITYGHQYRIFALRTPKPNAGVQNATHFSFPTPPITSAVQLTMRDAPLIYALTRKVFIAVFASAEPVSAIESHRLFFSPFDPEDQNTDSESLVANTLNMAGFSELVRGQSEAGKDLAHVADAILKRANSEMPSGMHLPQSAGSSFTDWLKEQAGGSGPCYIVYYSPFATSQGVQEPGTDATYVIGRYADMYGDILDFSNRSYVAHVLATGADLEGIAIQKSENVLSSPSAPLLQLRSELAKTSKE